MPPGDHTGVCTNPVAGSLLHTEGTRGTQHGWKRAGRRGGPGCCRALKDMLGTSVLILRAMGNHGRVLRGGFDVPVFILEIFPAEVRGVS